MASNTRPDSPYYSIPDADRGRPRVAFSLSPEAIARLEELSETLDYPKARIVEALLLSPGAAASVEKHAKTHGWKKRHGA